MLMLLLFILLLPLLLLFVLNSKRIYERQSDYGHLPPGPHKLPFIGNLHQLSRKSPHRALHKLAMRYGPLMSLQLGSSLPTVVVSSARMAREIMKTHDLDFSSRPSLLCQQKLSYGGTDLAFAPYGDFWREIRKICVVELFSTKRMQSFRFIREEEIFQLVKSISQQSANSSDPIIKLSEMVFALTNNIICRIAFGKKFLHEGSKKCLLLNETQDLLATTTFTDYFPSVRWVFDIVTGLHGRLQRNFCDLDLFYNQIIEEHLHHNRTKKPEKEDITDILLQMQQDPSTSFHLEMDHIKALFMNFLIGGTDASAATVIWAMTEVIKKPIVMKKTQDELRSLIGNKGHVDEDDLNQLHYLKCVVKETLRLHLPGPLLVSRETINHCKIDGYDIYPKTQVIVNAWAIGMDPEIWKNPEEFIPERFIDGSVDFKGQHFEFIPFRAGRRICPGIYLGVVAVELPFAENLLTVHYTNFL
uniref:Cytochrome P450 71A1-like n=1 Tax=Nelumbo nucifera TaxID=4432 RepID=A0A822ZS52_NELNU|nr:TPA_asm: hypothetical protein HUJ06_004611 [Nelumbo nucifera]